MKRKAREELYIYIYTHNDGVSCQDVSSSILSHATRNGIVNRFKKKHFKQKERSSLSSVMSPLRAASIKLPSTSASPPTASSSINICMHGPATFSTPIARISCPPTLSRTPSQNSRNSGPNEAGIAFAWPSDEASSSAFETMAWFVP